MGLVTADPEDCDPVKDPPVIAPDCERVERALWDLVDGEVAPEDVSQLRQHLDACSYCRTHEDFERRLAREIAQLRCEPADPVVLADQVRRRLTEAHSGS
jgi:anti-sigma factor (TIGR02949 family)